MRIAKEYTLAQLQEMAKRSELTRYGANTCWWGMDDAPWWYRNGQLPCDPRGGMLFQTYECERFIQSAQEHAAAGAYGRHGLRAFALAYHGCVVTEDGKPTCFEKWEDYNKLIDEKEDLS